MWALAALVLSAPMWTSCSSDDTSPSTDTGADVRDSGPGRDNPPPPPDGGGAPELDTETDSELEPDVDLGGDAMDDAEEDRDENVQCFSDAACPDRLVCIDGTCRQRCASERDCDDGSPCTEKTCEEGLCVFTPIDVQIADPVVGDCRTLACIDGRLTEIPSSTDVPPSDGISCTVARCAGQVPQQFPDHSLCDDGDDENGFEFCSVEEGGCALGDRAPWVCDDLDPGYGRDEICGDGLDNDGNGLVDEGCACEFGTTQRCFAGPPNARGVGACIDGLQRCIDRDNPRWSACEGGILPSEEICDAKDNSCNGCVDDLPDCVPLLSCPVEDFAQPLRFYPLDGSSIFDGDGLEWRWTVVAPPNSVGAGPIEPNASNTQVYLDVSGDYLVSVSVTDEKGDVYGCSWIVHVAGGGIRVEMRWDTFGSVDMDLHLHRSGTTTGFCTGDDCYFANCRGSGVDWGYAPSPASECEVTFGATSCPNPRLDIDNIRGFDPENINIDNPNDGDRFRVMAHKFSGSPVTNPVISIYCGGRLRAVLGEAPDGAALANAGGGCRGDTWRVADVIAIVDGSTGATDCIVDVLTDGSGGWDIRQDSSEY